MKENRNRYLLPLAAAFSLGLCSSAQAQAQKNLEQYLVKVGADGKKSYLTVAAIQEETSRKKNLTDTQIATLSKYIDNPLNLVRYQTLVALRHADTKHAEAAATVARKGLVSGDSMTRTYALTTLDRLNAPDIVLVAKSKLTDPSHYVTSEARKILAKREAG